MRPFLGQVRRRQVHCDPLRRQRKSDGRKCCMDSLAALGDRLVGQTDDRESRQTGRKLDLDFDWAGFEPAIRDSGDGGRHAAPPRFDTTLRRHPPSSARIC